MVCENHCENLACKPMGWSYHHFGRSLKLKVLVSCVQLQTYPEMLRPRRGSVSSKWMRTKKQEANIYYFTLSTPEPIIDLVSFIAKATLTQTRKSLEIYQMELIAVRDDDGSLRWLYAIDAVIIINDIKSHRLSLHIKILSDPHVGDIAVIKHTIIDGQKSQLLATKWACDTEHARGHRPNQTVVKRWCRPWW